MQLRGAPLSAHERAEPELDAEGAVAQLWLPSGRADLDPVEEQRRGGQQARINAACDADRHADQTGRFRLEGGAIAAPIDEQRPDQRRYQRHNDRDRQSKQRRLHPCAPSPNLA